MNMSKWVLPLGVALCAQAGAQLTLVSSFNPSNAGGLCSCAYSPFTDTIWVYDCSAADFQEYSTSGTFLQAHPRPGESANDVEIDIAPVDIVFPGPVTVPAGSVLFINGESGTADVYAVDPSSGTVIATLVTSFGTSHVVGGAYHPGRSTFFLVQDRVPASGANTVGEIDPTTGVVLNTFSTLPDFDVNFGDIDIGENGSLFLVSSIETTVAEFSPDGAFLQELTLPAGVGSLSGIAIAEQGAAWVGGTGGVVWELDGFPLAVCLADWNGDLIVNTADFLAFLNDYNAVSGGGIPAFGDPDLAPPIGVLNTSDFIAFLNLFNAGCP